MIANRWRILTMGMLLIFFPIIAVHAGTVPPSINPELAAHTRLFEKKIYKVADNVYSAVGWQLANIVMIEGNDGIIIVDTGDNTVLSRQILAEFRKITDKPIRAIIYTHFHPDHVMGAGAFTTKKNVDAGRVKIYAHDTLLTNVLTQGVVTGPILSMRTAYTIGIALPEKDREGMNGGIGPNPGSMTPSSFIAPTTTFSKELKVTIAGVDLEMYHVPSESPDEICVYLPQNNVLLSAEVIQGPTLPNVHTLRGTKFRDPVMWVDSLDFLRHFKAGYMVPMHGQPIYGGEKVEAVLTYTRDGIQFIHDQTIRYMNKGLTPDELVEVVKFPPYLADYKPYLREYYGTVKHAVRQIYAGYLGWFEGDPVKLDPTPPVERARRTVELMGGRDRVLEEARKALDGGDPQWCAELATLLVRIDLEDMAARQVKASAFRVLGYAQININWRNWYLMSATELEGTLDYTSVEKMQAVFLSPQMVQNLPPEVWVRAWTLKLDPKKSADNHMTLGFIFPDVEVACGLEVRRAVAQYHPRFPEKADVALILNKSFLDQVLTGKATLAAGMKSGEVKAAGNPADVQKFMGFFDLEKPRIHLTLR